MRFEVLVSAWNGYDGGVHEEARPSKELLRHLAGGEAAGVVKVLDATREHRKTLAGHVQSQADGEKQLAKAQKDGSWHEANQAQYDLDIASGNRDANDPTRIPVAEETS